MDYFHLTKLNNCLTANFGWLIANLTMFDNPKSAFMKSKNSSVFSSLIISNSLSHSLSDNPIHLSWTFPAELILDSIAFLQFSSYGYRDISSVLLFLMAFDATSPATLPNFIAYLIPSKTKGLAWPAVSPTKIKLLKTVLRDNPSFGINP